MVYDTSYLLRCKINHNQKGAKIIAMKEPSYAINVFLVYEPNCNVYRLRKSSI